MRVRERDRRGGGEEPKTEDAERSRACGSGTALVRGAGRSVARQRPNATPGQPQHLTAWLPFGTRNAGKHGCDVGYRSVPIHAGRWSEVLELLESRFG